MRLLFAILSGAILFSAGARADDPLPQQYLDTYAKISEAQLQEKDGHYRLALRGYENIYSRLAKFHQANMGRESAMVGHRMTDVYTKILELEPRALFQYGPTKEAASYEPSRFTAQFTPQFDPHIPSLTSSPPPVLPPDRPAAPPSESFRFAPASDRKNAYPWKTNITPSMFWIGEDAGSRNETSAWTANWVKMNGGADSPQDRNGYASGAHASTVGPFYVALPFNDLAYPDEARRWMPGGWMQKPGADGKPVTACKDRWVEIKNARDDICYAQWEDVGPEVNDDAGYVFGAEQPVQQPAISVSPAVAEYLGLGQNDGAKVSWRFVDDKDVRPGAWLKYDEQAILFRGMHGQ